MTLANCGYGWGVIVGQALNFASWHAHTFQVSSGREVCARSVGRHRDVVRTAYSRFSLV